MSHTTQPQTLNLTVTGAAPTILLDYLSAADIATALAISDSVYTDIGTNHTFTVGSASSVVGISVSGVIQAAGTGIMVARLNIDSAGTPILETLCGTPLNSANENLLAGCNPLYLAGLTAGAHTIKLQAIATVPGQTVNLQASSNYYEFLRIQILEFSA